MRLFQPIVAGLLSSSLVYGFHQQLDRRQSSDNEVFLNVTALVTDSSNQTAFECWQLTTPFAGTSVAGVSGSLNLNFGNVTNASYTMIPPRFDGGQHNAPSVQIVHFLSGIGHVTLPEGNTNTGELWALGGPYGLLIAADTVGSGHITTYPSDETTLAVQLPFEGGEAPEHTVLYSGICQRNVTIIP